MYVSVCVFLFQSKIKELAMLCFVKDVTLETSDCEQAVKELRLVLLVCFMFD